MLERVRSTTFALLGATALFGLVLVALMSQAGVPYLPSLPIPAGPSGQQAIGDAAVAAPSGDSIAPTATVAPALRAAAGTTAGGVGTGSGSGQGSHVAGSRQIAAAPVPPGSVANQPSDQGSPQPQPAAAVPPAPVATGPSPAPAPVGSAPKTRVTSSPSGTSTKGSGRSTKANGKAVGHSASKHAAGSSSVTGTSKPPRPAPKAAKAAKAEPKPAKAAKSASKASSKLPPPPSAVAAEQDAGSPAAESAKGTEPGGKGHSKH
jgi:hypothetical protein